MTIAVEPKMIYPGEGVVGIEDTFLVGAKGAERLTRLPQRDLAGVDVRKIGAYFLLQMKSVLTIPKNA